ncbi:MAG: FadR/GntR family transcriptional regulator [Betaproteobacteria bacterium]
MTPLEKESLPLKLAAKLRSRIAAGSWVAGARLPAEREIAQQFAVSRSVVREAYTILAAQGVIYTRQGGGAFVCESLGETAFDAVPFVLPAGERTLLELMVVRKSIEPAAAELAATRGSEEELRAIEYAAQAIEGASSLEDKITAGILFHLAVARASGNRLMIRIIASLLDLVVASHRITLNTVEGHIEGVIDHDAIGRAIRSRRPAEARKAMWEHLCHTERLLHPGAAQTSNSKPGRAPRRAQR